MIYLRKMEEKDTDLIITWRNSDAVRPYFIYQEPFTREGHKQWVETMIDTGRAFQFMVCDCDTDEPIGCTYLRDYDKVHNKIEYGMFLGSHTPKGKGIGTQMVRLTFEYAFHTLQVHKVVGRVLATNEASNRSAKKAGFLQEAYLREEVLIKGIYEDVILYGILEEEFKR